MPKNVACHDDCFKKAAGFLMKFPTMKLPEAMKLADFTPVEQKDRAKHMVVHRLLKKTKGSNVTPPPSVVNVSTAGTVTSSENDKSSVSDITDTNVPVIKRIRTNDERSNDEQTTDN